MIVYTVVQGGEKKESDKMEVGKYFNKCTNMMIHTLMQIEVIILFIKVTL